MGINTIDPGIFTDRCHLHPLVLLPELHIPSSVSDYAGAARNDIRDTSANEHTHAPESGAFDGLPSVSPWVDMYTSPIVSAF
jgi:hypothetical protein